MTTSNECVVAVFDTLDEAKESLHQLDGADIPAGQVSLVTRNVSEEVRDVESMQLGDKTEKNAATGAGIGGLVGLLLGTPLLTIPGVGLMLLAGPVGAGIAGALVGGFLGAMGGWGMHEDHVQQYEEKVKAGKVLVVVNGDPEQVAHAQSILRSTDAEEVHLHAATSDDDPAIDDRPM